MKIDTIPCAFQAALMLIFQMKEKNEQPTNWVLSPEKKQKPCFASQKTGLYTNFG
jgi:hypothetical protein